MSDKVQCFVAYPSDPPSRAESVELAIEEIKNGGVVEIAGWKSTSVGGRIIISAICEEVRKCQLFVADVTGLNPNVLFELGYAISLNKRIWLLFDTNIERAKQ
jgi:nucleoside 2-deoxyribosyltransferase